MRIGGMSGMVLMTLSMGLFAERRTVVGAWLRRVCVWRR